MLGSCFLKHLAGDKDFEMYAFDKDLDITNFEELSKKFEKISPNFVINCAAYTDVDGCESNKEVAFKTNGESLVEIAKACKKYGSILIHFSTDYVFDGKKEDGYCESDSPNPINVYGESKMLGEKMIIEAMNRVAPSSASPSVFVSAPASTSVLSSPSTPAPVRSAIDSGFYIIRTSWLFGPNGKNFVDTMIKLSHERDELNVVGDQIGSPTYTNDLTSAVIDFFLAPYLVDLPTQHEHSLKNEHEHACHEFAYAYGAPIKKLPFGIYHLTNSGICSWYEFAKKLFELKNIDVKVNAITSDELLRPAKRPSCSILKNTKLMPLRHWEEALKAYLS